MEIQVFAFLGDPTMIDFDIFTQWVKGKSGTHPRGVLRLLSAD